jgi:hypothetical protein
MINYFKINDLIGQVFFFFKLKWEKNATPYASIFNTNIINQKLPLVTSYQPTNLNDDKVKC